MYQARSMESTEISLEDIKASVREHYESITALKKKAVNKLIQEKIQSLYNINNDLYSIIETLPESLKDLNIDASLPGNLFITRIHEEFESDIGLPEPGKFIDQETKDLIAKYIVIYSIFRDLEGASDRIHDAIKSLNQNSKKDRAAD